ncbi:folylpolyglutamate synthase/dihydrofolate synthase family protein [Lacticaseibacillus sp. 866-1]|uniref:bifunctional folylpolyglutamate synthase/dihydrofolate synthase n=1 Tax=Lacticaseibacillus sp. 866-1 TaxID=2799576 RepID=UPI001941E59D|nr:folylpolyglutamate synthase/dihydrofolate synthase family protein [Lacticaseibacillus sp. 866-1]
MKTYDETVAAIHALPRLAKTGGHERILALLHALGDPQHDRYVHVTGTNGKGSTASGIAHIMEASGLKVGLYTSPFIMRFNERIMIDHQPIPDADLVAAAATTDAAMAKLRETDPDFGVTEFEYITALAFWYFHQQQVDLAVIEVGIGGDTDSTNVITPEVSVITSVGLDHAKLLGHTIKSVATHKAGIIKPQRPVVTAALPADAMAAVKKRVAETGSQWLVAGQNFGTSRAALDGWGQRFDYQAGTFHLSQVFVPLVGDYQVQNAALAIAASRVAAKAMNWPLQPQEIRRGLAKNTWPARMEKLSDDPLIVIDGGHNPQGIAAMLSAVKQVFNDERVTLIVGVLADKDVATIIAELEASTARLWLVPVPDNPRAEALADYPDAGKLRTFASWQEALAAHLDEFPDEPVVLTGSLYLASAVRQTLLGSQR